MRKKNATNLGVYFDYVPARAREAEGRKNGAIHEYFKGFATRGDVLHFNIGCVTFVSYHALSFFF